MKNRMEVVLGDITRLAVDVIVNAANTSLLGGGGVDGAIHRAGGPAILEGCRAIVARQGGCRTGEAVITGAGRLPAQWVVHTVGPVWNGGASGEEEKLASCYRHSLALAAEKEAATVAFPAISTGVYHFPKSRAARIAVWSTAAFLQESALPGRVLFVCFDSENYEAIEAALNNLPQAANEEASRG